MAKFCTRCGRPLEEGEVCSCSQEAVQVQPAAAAQTEESTQAATTEQTAQATEESAQAAAEQPAQAPEESAQAATAEQPAQAAAQNQQNAQPQAAAQSQQNAQPQAAAQNQQNGQNQQFQQSQQAQQNQQFQQTQQAVKGVLARTLGTFLNILKHPVTAGRDVILAGDAVSSMVLIALQAILSTIFGVVAAKKIYSVVSMFIGGFGSLFGSYGDVKMPYVKIIFGTLVLSIVLSFVLVVLLFLANMIIKNTLSFKQMLGAAAIRSSVASLATLIAIIVFLISPTAGILVFLTGTVWGFFIILLAIPLANEGMRNKLPLTMILVFFIFMGITVFTMDKGANLYVPSEDSYSTESWFD